MTFQEYCEQLGFHLRALRHRYSNRAPMGENFDWDLNWTMKTMRKGSSILEDIHTDVLEKGLPDDESFALVIENLQNFVFLEDVVILENYTEMAISKLERLRKELVRGAENRVTPKLDELDV